MSHRIFNIHNLLIVVLSIISSEYSRADDKSDIGLLLGGAYYMGDINNTRLFYNPGINIGITYRYNINMRYVVKFEGNYLRLSGNDKDFDDPYQQRRNNEFFTPVYDFALQFEFNFLDIKFANLKKTISPFVSSGLGCAYAMRSQSKSIMLVLPFAIGVRTSIGKFWSFGIQWNYRKLFNDNIDDTSNEIPKSMKLAYFNNDWYSMASVFVTYKLFHTKLECPAYKKE